MTKKPAAKKATAPPPDAELWTVDEVAAFLRTSKGTIYNKVSRGQLPGVVKIGERVLFRARDIRAYVGL